jgi:two-component system response regulator DegU
VVASNRTIWRDGITAILEKEEDIVVEYQVSDILKLDESVAQIIPRIVIIDEEIFSISAANHLLTHIALYSNIILVLPRYDECIEIAGLKLGIKGFILETAKRADLLKCIRSINRGELWVRRTILAKLIEDAVSSLAVLGAYEPPSCSMNKREQDIIFLVCRGLKNKDIATMLYISEKTVKHYLTNIFKKLNVNTRKELGKLFINRLPLIFLAIYSIIS